MCSVLAKLTSKNQLTLPKSVTEAIGPVQYFEVQARAGQIVLTPVRIQRGDGQTLLNASIFFDFRGLWGETGLAEALRVDIAARAKANPRFLKQMSDNRSDT